MSLGNNALALSRRECQIFFRHLLKPLPVQPDRKVHRHLTRLAAADLMVGRAGLFFEEKSMTFRPLHDRILVRRVEAEEKTAGGIIIPDTVKEKPQEGEVVAAGPGARDDSGQLQPLDVKPGDRILFGKWSGTEIRLDGEELLIMKESDVMGIIEMEEAAKRAA
jgi:chaperonin GroES